MERPWEHSTFCAKPSAQRRPYARFLVSFHEPAAALFRAAGEACSAFCPSQLCCTHPGSDFAVHEFGVGCAGLSICAVAALWSVVVSAAVCSECRRRHCLIPVSAIWPMQVLPSFFRRAMQNDDVRRLCLCLHQYRHPACMCTARAQASHCARAIA